MKNELEILKSAIDGMKVQAETLISELEGQPCPNKLIADLRLRIAELNNIATPISLELEDIEDGINSDGEWIAVILFQTRERLQNMYKDPYDAGNSNQFKKECINK